MEEQNRISTAHEPKLLKAIQALTVPQPPLSKTAHTHFSSAPTSSKSSKFPEP